MKLFLIEKCIFTLVEVHEQKYFGCNKKENYFFLTKTARKFELRGYKINTENHNYWQLTQQK